jgi:lipopolysaccharide transport system ATP-binding protein
MSDDVLVKVDNVSKRFCRSLKRSLWYGMQDLGSELGGRRHGGGSGLPQSSADVQLRPDEFWAVKDVSFELRRGECLGLIGRNGAGKTTLLKMLNGLIKPDTGRIELKGRTGALIALGAGFNPILTGRENIYTNASIIGLSKAEITGKINNIIDFAEIGEFVDSPVQTYSSGMQVRLGFAIAAELQPDVMILDEVLAVGDSNFKYKCYSAIDKILKHSAVIFVTHDMGHLGRIAQESIVLKKGCAVFKGEVQIGIRKYEELNDRQDESISQIYRPLTNHPVIGGSILSPPDTISSFSSLDLRFALELSDDLPVSVLRVDIRKLGEIAASGIMDSQDVGIILKKGCHTYEAKIDCVTLRPGPYTLNMNITNKDGNLVFVWDVGHKLTIKGGDPRIVSNCQLPMRSWKHLFA